jgi:hypothetical protein
MVAFGLGMAWEAFRHLGLHGIAWDRFRHFPWPWNALRVLGSIPSTLASSFHPSEYDKTYVMMYLHIIQDSYILRPYMNLVEEAIAPHVRISGAEVSMSEEKEENCMHL